MKKKFVEKLGKERLFFDGGTGTVLQLCGLLPGEPPEVMNDRAPWEVKSLHIKYIRAGADIIKTNSFGINPLRYSDYERRLRSAVDIAKEAVRESGREAYVALDIGPSGRLIEPFGDLPFEDAVAAFKECGRLAEELGADLVLIETMSDLMEVKAALLGVKEGTSLPVIVTCAFGSDGRMTTGGTPAAALALIEGMGADAVGVNCSTGPREMLPIAEELCRLSSIPVVANPNAGLPTVKDGVTAYDVDQREFSAVMRAMAEAGVSVLGGCCGTTPEYISSLCDAVRDIPYTPPVEKDVTLVSSFARAVQLGKEPVIVGERINPTGKPKMKAALREGDVSYILSEAVAEEDEGAHILDVNMGLADIDERAWLVRAVRELQTVTPLPLQLDTGRCDALEGAIRIYGGKPIVNSVNGSQNSINSVLPLVKKYGAAVIALTMDESGIPDTVEGRVEIAERIVLAAESYGIRKRELIFDPLTLTVASGDNNALVTLGTVRELKRRGYKCALGVSNVSFGLPERDAINSAFFTEALWSRLDLAIVNPHSPSMMNAYYSYLALSGKDRGCIGYVRDVRAVGTAVSSVQKKSCIEEERSLGYAIERGFADMAEAECVRLLESKSALEVINGEIIPALNRVGDAFEGKRIFLPNLLSSAEAASRAFAEIKARQTRADVGGRAVLLATVKGDIHDIGKNIVKLMLESYGYKVVDLGRDVAPERVLEALRSSDADIVGLSALMTTTLPAMEQTVALIHREMPHVRVMVGGAVLTETYAESIGAYYAPDAISAVKLVEVLRSSYGGEKNPLKSN